MSSRTPCSARSCHALAAAGSNGQVGPNLDVLAPTFEQVRTQVANGGGAMPAYGDDLTAAEIRDVAAFVAGRAGR